MKLSEYLLKNGRGALSKLSSDIDAHASDVSRWAAGTRSIPPEFCVKIENATSGNVSRIDLMPERWKLIWPELTKASNE